MVNALFSLFFIPARKKKKREREKKKEKKVNVGRLFFSNQKSIIFFLFFPRTISLLFHFLLISHLQYTFPSSFFLLILFLSDFSFALIYHSLSSLSCFLSFISFPCIFVFSIYFPLSSFLPFPSTSYISSSSLWLYLSDFFSFTFTASYLFSVPSCISLSSSFSFYLFFYLFYSIFSLSPFLPN